ncbi:U7 snRNA-associated Sm-like protein LSm11 [Neodiprion fabricii]|uniref:U7 snRNA-associated Sm-like protein LSm11 n=1 Tax=Neodiprion fabricii TaxID=2872261 RepID=UPI001ED8CCB8|nr:U7 snRNA-associated Sm-like protein LSm11 [Neodiprion fabricii]
MEGSSSSDDSLDALSDKFEPLKALYSPKLRLPVPGAKVYDNLGSYESNARGQPRQKSRGPGSKENAEQLAGATPKRRFLPHQEPVPGSKSRNKDRGGAAAENLEGRNVLTRMKGSLGPLEMLLRCMEQRTRVKVYTRGACSIRGYVLAYVAAFDKHWNLALEDCLEVWTRKVKRKAPALGAPADSYQRREFEARKIEDESYRNTIISKTVVKESNGKTETLERHVPQLMIRGEQIAMIVKID